MAFMLSFMAFLFLLDSLMVSLFTSINLQGSSTSRTNNGRSKEFKQDSVNFWEEPYHQASKSKPCADKTYPTSPGKPANSNGYIMITDADIVKEAKPDDYFSSVLPLLLENRVVHFLGFGNRLGFDPLPPHLQRLRCKCNFHALKFVPKIQEVGSLLVKRIRKHYAARRQLDIQLLGDYAHGISSEQDNVARGSSRYLALHLRFEEDMVAYSLCDFGGGQNEKKELQAYREVHFPLLIERLRNSKPVSQVELRKLGRCPLTPEEVALVLAALGFKPETYIYLAGSHIYGGNSRMHPFTSLYPNLVTKETLLSPIELAPFRNFSSQLAAVDFIACATSDVFAMTDSGSQLSSLVSGFRTYYGDGHAPTLRPNKKRLASILAENRTIG